MPKTPQLADKLDDLGELINYAVDDAWCWEQKLDGDRLMVEVVDGKVSGINRRGVQRVVPHAISSHFSEFNGRWLFDGEEIDGVFWPFDLPEAPGNDYEGQPYRVRRELLERAVARIEGDAVRLLPCAKTNKQKVELYKRLQASHAEGIMVKNLDGKYLYGPRRSRDMLKAKFFETIDCIVTVVGREGKNSIGVTVYDEDGHLYLGPKGEGLGSCTVQPRMLDVLQPGNVIEVKYLYLGVQGRLYQPSFLRVRHDKSPQECTIDQVKIGCKEVVQLTVPKGSKNG